MRWGLGPVFVFDWLTSSRRWLVYATRSFVVTALLVSLAWMWWANLRDREIVTFQQLAEVGEVFFYALAGTQLVLVLITAPAATAGAICQDKARGVLSYLLVTDLSDAEIVLGKLASRAIPAIGFVACGVPVMALGMLIGGIDPLALLGTALIALGLALLGSALALTLSVWASKSHEVLLGTYLAWGLWLLFVPVSSVVGHRWFGATVGNNLLVSLTPIDPFRLAWAPYAQPGSVSLLHYVVFFTVCLLLSAALAVLAVRKTRAVYLRQAGRRPPERRPSRLAVGFRHRVRWWPAPSLDANPVLWREWHRHRRFGLGQVVALIYAGFALVFTVYVAGEALSYRARSDMAPWVNALQVSGGLLMTAIIASTTLSEERARGSLDVLLATPLPTHTIVLGKWWGAFRSVPLLMILPVALAYLLYFRNHNFWAGPYLFAALILAYGAALASLGLALATWVKSQGRAIALTLTCYLLVTVAWFALVASMFNHGDFGRDLAMASPFFGPGMITAVLADPSNNEPRISSFAAWTVVWISAYAIAALGLLFATLVTFDRCLGRMPEGSWPGQWDSSPSKDCSTYGDRHRKSEAAIRT